VIVLLFLSAAGIASAQVLEISASGGPNLLSNRTLAVDSAFGQVDLKNGFQIAFRMTLNAYRYMGHEVGYAYNRTNLLIGDGTIHGMAAHQGLYDLLVYARPEGAKIRPFIAGGGQFSNFIFPGGSVTSGGSGQMKFGVNYGFGVKVRVTEKWLIRADFRQYATPKPDFAELGATTAPQGWLKMNAITAGVGFTL
jgi:opacity protein-like surface antigen